MMSERACHDFHSQLIVDRLHLPLPWVAGALLAEVRVSKRNGDKARFQKDRKRKLRHRERIRQLAKTLHGDSPKLIERAEKQSGV